MKNPKRFAGITDEQAQVDKGDLLRRLRRFKKSLRHWVRKNFLRRPWVRKILVRTGVRQWGTKSFECWTFLMVMLVVVRPKGIVELGSGRSTSYLTEYAMKEGTPFASIEQNRFYVARNKRGLKNSFLSDGYLHHVPIDEDGWYDVEELNRVVDFPCELLFVDGPTEFHAQGSRHTERSSRWLAAMAATSKILIVDDVDRRSSLEMFHELVATSGRLSPLYLPYRPARNSTNVLAIAVESSSYDALVKVCSEVGIELLDDYSVDQCRAPK